MSDNQVYRHISGIVVFIGLAMMAFAQPALAQAKSVPRIVVSHDMGGSIGRRQDKLRKMRREGQQVEIRGRCYSACTMYLGLPNVCVTPEASLGFHGPRGIAGGLSSDVFEHWSRVMVRNLHPKLQSWFMKEARYVKSGVLRISGAKLIAMGYRRCGSA